MRGSEIRNSEQELHQFQVRVGVAGIAVVVAFALLAARFLYLQVLQHDVYRAKAEDNRISVVPVTPNRGLIVDRHGVVVARNYSGYTLEIFPRKVRNIERTIDELTEYVDITNRARTRCGRRPDPRPHPLQEAAAGDAQRRDPAAAQPPIGRGSGEVRRQSLPLR